MHMSHDSDVIMGAMASQITSPTSFYSTVYSGADQRKHQSYASLAFARGIHRWPVNSPHKWPVTRKMFPFDDVIMAFHKPLWLQRICYTMYWWMCICMITYLGLGHRYVAGNSEDYKLGHSMFRCLSWFIVTVNGWCSLILVQEINACVKFWCTTLCFNSLEPGNCDSINPQIHVTGYVHDNFL